MNARVSSDKSGIESVMGQQGAECKMNDNEEVLTDFYVANELVIGGALFLHKEWHNVTWFSLDWKIQNQIDHIALSL